MLTQETKRKIDSARDILVGKVPDPKAQVEQITTAMIYKFMDDMDKDAVELGGNARFFTKGFEKYAWSKLLDSKLGGHERLELYGEAIVQMSSNPHIPQLFRDIFKDAFLPYRDPETLSLFLKEINSFVYEHSEDLGDAFEYLLSIMGSQGDAGQFRTPRHIIDFIVAVVAPKKDESILDPACGTAGFLISAYKHILKQHDGKEDPENKEKPLTPDDKKKLMNNLVGYDISPDMVKLSKVNMYLHGFAEPKISEYDTLSSDEKWDEMYDVILANPPFMTPKGGIRPHKRFSVQANRAEVLFVDYIKEHLKPNGRAGIIVPEGIIFQSGGAYKQLRKMLVEDGLFAVASLPGGVFNPYSGVKTSILFFDSALAKKTNEILFLKIDSDGFDLGAQRRKTENNDLTKALVILRQYIKDSKLENLKDVNNIARLISKELIAKDGDYNLSGEQYILRKDISDAKWPMVELSDLFEMINGRAFKKDEWKTNGLPIIRIANLNDEKATYNYFDGSVDEKILVTDGDLLFSWSGTRGTSFGPHIWKRGKGVLNQHIYRFKPLREDINISFAYHVIKQIVPDIEAQAHGAGGLVHITKAKLERFKIPLPPIEIQNKIVEEINRYQKIINGAKQIVDNWIPNIEVEDGWGWKKLEEVCELITDGTHQTPTYVKDGTIFLSSRNVVSQKINWSDIKYIPESLHKQLSKRLSPKVDDVLLAKNGTTGVAAIVDRDLTFDIYVSLALLRPSELVLPKYLLHIINSPLAKEQFNSRLHGVGVPNLHLREIKEVKIPVPSLEEQKEIVAKIEVQQDTINEQKALIQRCERKIEWKLSQILQNLPHFNDLFLETKIEDDFGWSSEWNEEIEAWLNFIDKEDSDYYKTHRNRAKNPKQRDELLGEYKAAYFIQERAEGKILKFEPPAFGSYKYDFSFQDLNDKEWVAEVKSPSWRGVVSKDIDEQFMLELRGRMAIVGGEKYPECKAEMTCPSCEQAFKFIVSNIENKDSTNEELKKLICPKCKKNLWNLSEQERSKAKAKRFSLPQFINGEGSWLGFDIFEEAIINSLDKFEKGKNNLLILCPNSFAEMGFFGALENWHHLREMVKRLDTDNKISCIGVFEVSLSDGFKYHCSLVDIKDHPKLNDNVKVFLNSKS